MWILKNWRLNWPLHTTYVMCSPEVWRCSVLQEQVADRLRGGKKLCSPYDTPVFIRPKASPSRSYRRQVRANHRDQDVSNMLLKEGRLLWRMVFCWRTASNSFMCMHRVHDQKRFDSAGWSQECSFPIAAMEAIQSRRPLNETESFHTCFFPFFFRTQARRIMYSTANGSADVFPRRTLGYVQLYTYLCDNYQVSRLQLHMNMANILLINSSNWVSSFYHKIYIRR